ncbi:terminase small subunit [Pasteurella multocida]|uniref:terminase small subunit n=1 Tax=Pasteurella multocida TaxID=747 RepID=UPI00099A4E29|nr:terminase small subunit [Pasteurella multocida]MCL7756101.1 terminase small subunit [Pasteurella multocida]MCL7779831.1 terminase small subunit [Pasteurella multocida]MCL7783383.1 terminase small subunit [Pasteurella multocida]MCL7785597.1 terminase small subunit [Pasteurella multocida]OPC90895.1 terminase [Pasteurella multocida subsp. septica]
MPKKDEVKSTSKGRGKTKLTDKQKRFVEEYLIDLNATQAAIRAGYAEKAANREGSRLLSNVDIQEAIQKAQNTRAERVQISQDDVLRDLMELRDMCMGRKSFIVTDTVKNNQEGTVNTVDNHVYAFEPAGANKALELLGKHLGMFKERVDLTNSDSSLNRPTIIELVSPSVNSNESTD